MRPAVDRTPASAGEVSGAEAQKSQAGSALDDLPPAKAVVSHPDPMQVDHEETVKVPVSLDLQAKLGDNSEDGLLKGQHMENSELAVKGSPFLGVEIKESPHFKVRYLGPDNQRLQSLGKDAATWAFSVTPVDAGQWKLHIVVTNYAAGKRGRPEPANAG